MRGALSTALAIWAAGCVATPAPPANSPKAASAASAPAAPPSAPPAPLATHAPSHEHEDEPDDGEEPLDPDPAAPEVEPQPRAPHPLEGKSAREIAADFARDPTSIGSISLGRPSAGGLLNGVQMPRGSGWTVMDPAHAWGTRETVDYLVKAITLVRARFPDSHDVYVGHISARRGGALRPHVSHQAGRDVDLSYFYNDDSARWYRRATEANLDRARTWAFVRALVTDTDVELILIDRALQGLLSEHALSVGEDPAWVQSLFHGTPGAQRPLIFHAKGHATHLHVRFYNPIAQESASRAHQTLAAHGYANAATAFATHRARPGETLGMLAKKYGTTVREIQLANGLKNTRIRTKQVYRIPRRDTLGRPVLVRIPPRRLPPSGAGKSAARER